MQAAARDLLETDPVTGGRIPMARYARRALNALNRAELPYAVIGARGGIVEPYWQGHRTPGVGRCRSGRAEGIGRASANDVHIP